MKRINISLMPCVVTACALFIANPSKAPAQGPATAPPYRAYYNPALGFKPAQPNLTKIFLQIAGSLEDSGSPEGYIRHMQKEHARISRKFADATGQAHVSRMPAHMTPEYLDRLISNWNVLSPKLGLDALAKEAGRCARESIRGTNNKGTTIINVLNEHQAVTAEAMQKTNSAPVDFERLQSRLEAELGLLPQAQATKIIAGQQERYFALLAQEETALTEAERKDYISLLRHPRFTKAGFPELESFYKKPYDKLSEQGKDELSQRVWAGTHPDEAKAIKADAISAANQFFNTKATLLGRIDASLKPEMAAKIKAAIDGVFRDLGRLAQSELELAILEYAVSK